MQSLKEYILGELHLPLHLYHLYMIEQEKSIGFPVKEAFFQTALVSCFSTIDLSATRNNITLIDVTDMTSFFNTS